MEFGFNFFPDVSPQVKSGQQYFREALNLVELGERYGYPHVGGGDAAAVADVSPGVSHRRPCNSSPAPSSPSLTIR